MVSQNRKAFAENLKRYAHGEMTGLELATFENKLKNDAVLRQELLQEITLSLAAETDSNYELFDTYWSKEALEKLKKRLQTKGFQLVSEKTKTAEEVVYARPKKRKVLQKYYRYFGLAGILILILCVIFLRSDHKMRPYYDAHANWSELPTFMLKGNTTDAHTKGEIAFRKEDYETAVTYFNSVTPENASYPNSLMYLGVSYDMLSQEKKAIETFKKLAALEDTYQSSRGNWYLALLYFKTDQKEEAVKALEKVAQDSKNFNYQKAKVLLRKIS